MINPLQKRELAKNTVTTSEKILYFLVTTRFLEDDTIVLYNTNKNNFSFPLCNGYKEQWVFYVYYKK